MSSALGLPGRAAILGVLFFVEKIFLTQFVDLERADAALGIGATFRHAQHFGFRFIVALLAALTVFAVARRRPPPWLTSSPAHPARLQPVWMAAHLALIVCLAWLSSLLFSPTPPPIPFMTVVGLWLACSAAAVFSAFTAMAPVSLWLEGARALGVLWLYSIAAADPATRILGTPRFAVEILDWCSGLEGMSLILAFTIAWLWYFRKEYRFPRALLLIPLGLMFMFGLNAVRIAVLVLVGNAGYSEVAVFGFHSQAGWIAFNAVAVGIAIWSQRSRWLNRVEKPLERNHSDNPTAVFLMPLLAILAAGMLSHALSGRFEWLYPLRLLACLAAIVIYRKRLAALEWRWSWRGPLLGIGVFVIWFVGVHFLVPDAGMPQELAAASPSLRWGWIGCRVAASVLTVPLAEELAYRGFLMRRLQARDFDSLAYERVGWFAVAASSVLFGAAHGALWLPGSVAGCAYGWIVKRRGQLGEAVVAHMTTNLLVAAVALGLDNWAGF